MAASDVRGRCGGDVRSGTVRAQRSEVRQRSQSSRVGGGGVLIVGDRLEPVDRCRRGCSVPVAVSPRLSTAGTLTAAPSTGSPETSPSAGPVGLRGERHQQLDPELRQQPGGPDEDPDCYRTSGFQATLSDSAAARDLVAQLPVTIDMVDHGAVEKTGALPSPLSLDGQPEGAEPGVGDVGYYAPGNDVVFYYGGQSHFPAS
jgi:hypothetical protein